MGAPVTYPCYIDTDGYTDRDREMFAAGAEYLVVCTLLLEGWKGVRPIHAENESRFRMVSMKLGRVVEIESGKEAGWSTLTAR